MKCSKCGQPVTTGMRFCSNCGSRVIDSQMAPLNYAATAADRIPHDEPLMVLRPTFIWWISIVGMIPIQLFMTVWGAGFCGGFSTVGLKFIERFFSVKLPGYIAPVFFGCLFFFGIPVITLVRKWRSYAKTEYRFYRDRLEYYEGFFTIEQKVVYYRDVLEVLLTRGIVQRRYGLGTILLANLATSVDARSRSGIRVMDITDPNGVYEEVKRLVHSTKTSMAQSAS
jgi:membrane protein YdbS with pleckstrin-like domain